MDVLSFELILVPIHEKNHWSCVVADISHHVITYYDSLSSNDPGIFSLPVTEPDIFAVCTQTVVRLQIHLHFINIYRIIWHLSSTCKVTSPVRTPKASSQRMSSGEGVILRL